MSCPRHDDLSAYADGMLAESERARFMLHLDACPACRARLDMLAALQGQLRALPSPQLGFDLAARLEERIRTAAPRSRSARPVRPRWLDWRSAGAGVAVALSLAAGGWLGALLIGGASVAPRAGAAAVFDPVPPGGLCAAPELCRLKRGMP